VAAPFTYEIRVRYAECDAQGCVFNANYLMYFDTVVTELWREVAGSYSAMLEAGIDMVVAEAKVRYLKPVLFDDVVTIEASVTRMGRSSITTAFTVVRNGGPAAEGELRHVFVEAGTSKKTDVPPAVRRGLDRYATAPA
jgi:acyl-CoA thioester hydrolase